MEYVQQIQKLRKEQRYYSMWELPPLLEVETDGLGADAAATDGSDGSLSPAATSGVTSCSSDSAWSEVVIISLLSTVYYSFLCFSVLLCRLLRPLNRRPIRKATGNIFTCLNENRKRLKQHSHAIKTKCEGGRYHVWCPPIDILMSRSIGLARWADQFDRLTCCPDDFYLYDWE